MTAEDPQLIVTLDDRVLTCTFNRSEARNAMTWEMYDGLHEACETADHSADVMVLRGSGDTAFIAGTDIAQFEAFSTGQDGVDYETRITRVVNRLEAVNIPTIAAVQGFCVGGGLAIAAACDLRIATETARFGVPIARTLGNCLSSNTMSLLLFHLGPARTLDLLLRARLLTGAEAHGAGFVSELVDQGALDEAVAGLVETLRSHAPLTMWAAKELTRRARQQFVVEDNDVVARVFGSDDFARAVRAFGDKTLPKWGAERP